MPGKVRVEAQFCSTQDFYTESSQWQVRLQRANVVYEMHKQMSVLSEIIPSDSVSAAYPLTISVQMWNHLAKEADSWPARGGCFLSESSGCSFDFSRAAATCSGLYSSLLS